jgi:hypothetical protein
MFDSFPFVMDFNALAPFLIPIVAILGAFTVGIVSMVLKSRQEERAHRERMFLAEKGLEIQELHETRPHRCSKTCAPPMQPGLAEQAQHLRWLRTR